MNQKASIFAKIDLSNKCKYDTIIVLFSYGEIAQLARAIGSYPIGRGFDSLSRYQFWLIY